MFFLLSCEYPLIEVNYVLKERHVLQSLGLMLPLGQSDTRSFLLGHHISNLLINGTCCKSCFVDDTPLNVLGKINCEEDGGLQRCQVRHINRILGESMLKIRCTRIARMSMISYVGYLRNEHIIAHDIVERDSNENHAGESR